MKKKFIIIALSLFLSQSLFSQTYNVPEILYYKFNNGTTTTPNYAVPGQGLSTAVLLGGQTCGQTGQFDSALVGAGGSSTSAYVNTGWNMNLGASSWTISLWLNNIPTSGTCYIFGNDISTSFRCFTNGAAGTGNITLRANNFSNVDVTGVLPGPSVIHFVYDSAAATVATYVNGVYQSTVSQSPLNLTASVVFKVGGYGTGNAIGAGWLVDEFRFYSRALDSTEIAATWNHELPYTVTGVEKNINETATRYTLGQNYPNPFNPVTKIEFTVPKDEFVTIKVYDVLGSEAAELVSKQMKAGSYEVTFDASLLSSGIYFYRMQAGRYIETRKMMLVK